jgi:hypothetical protein
VSGEDLVLEQAEEDRVVSLIERVQAVKVVPFRSNHILGTALPPLRWVAFGVEAP